MNQTICQSCQDDTTDYLNHALTSSQGKVTVCDYCYQELSTLRKQGNQWVESVSLDGVEYRKEESACLTQ